MKYFTFHSLNKMSELSKKNGWFGIGGQMLIWKRIAFAVKAHLVEFQEEVASSPQMASNPRSKEIN